MEVSNTVSYAAELSPLGVVVLGGFRVQSLGSVGFFLRVQWGTFDL